MTITPLFHVTCHHCGKFVTVPGGREQLPDGFHNLNGRWLERAQEAALESAKCLDDTCQDCMSIVYEAQAKERDFQAERDLS